MKSVKTMAYNEMEKEVITLTAKMATASLGEKRELIKRSHDLMVEMDRRWNAK